MNIFIQNFKKIICIILSMIFYIIGIIGLALPIVPQVPFFIIGTIFLVIGFKSIKSKIVKSELYTKYLEEIVNKNNILKNIFEQEK